MQSTPRLSRVAGLESPPPSRHGDSHWSVAQPLTVCKQCVRVGGQRAPPSPDPRPGLSFGSGDHTGGLDGRCAVSFEGNVKVPHPSFTRLPTRRSPHACLHAREHHTLVWGPSDENKTRHRLEKKASDFMDQFGNISETELRDGIRRWLQKNPRRTDGGRARGSDSAGAPPAARKPASSREERGATRGRGDGQGCCLCLECVRVCKEKELQ